MLLLITDQTVTLDGAALPVAQPFLLSASIWHHYEQIPHPRQGQWLAWDPKTCILHIHTHPHGIWPLSYHASPGLIAVSHSTGEVAQALRDRGHSLTMDTAAMWESMLIGHPLVDRTVFKEVHKTLIGEELILSLSGSAHTLDHWCPRIGGETRASEEDLLAEAAEVLRAIFGDLAQQGPFLLPLSGGLDSRLIAAMLARSGAKVRTFTFGSFGSAEVPLARRVAHELGLPWEMVSLRPDDYVTYGKRVVDLTGGTLSPMHMHLYSCLARLEPRRGETCVHGYLGDPISGDHAEPVSPGKSDDPGQIGSLAKSVLGLAKDLGIEDLPAGIRQDLDDIAADCALRNGEGSTKEFLFITDRQNMIAYIPAVLETLMPVVRPYADHRYVSFFLSLPQELRVGRRLFLRVMERLCPEVARLPSTTSPFGPRVPARIAQLLVKGFNALQYTTAALSQDRFVAYSPYIYEQRLLLLKQHLQQLLPDVAAAASEILGCDVSDLFDRAIAQRRHNLPFAALGAVWAFEAEGEMMLGKGCL